MGRLGNNPSSRAYATPTYATTSLTSRETFGGTSKAGLGRHIGMGRFTYGAIVNASSGHQASFLAGNSFPAAFGAGRLLDKQYPISKTNQLARVGTGTTGGMTRTPADGVNTQQREKMQERVDKWNDVWPSLPIRDTPNDCCKTIPYLNHDEDHTNVSGNLVLYGGSIDGWQEVLLGYIEQNFVAFSTKNNGNDFVAITDGGYIYYSTDKGVTWERASGAPKGYLRSVVTNGGHFVVGGFPNKNAGGMNNIYYSPDGIMWTQATASFLYVTEILSNGQKFLAVNPGEGDEQPTMYYSTDTGSEWQESNLPNSVKYIAGVAGGNGIYISIMQIGTGNNNYNSLYKSTDGGETWAALLNVGIGSETWSNVYSNGSTFIVVGIQGNSWTNNTMYFYDGTNWSDVSNGASSLLADIYYIQYVVSNGQNYIITGIDDQNNLKMYYSSSNCSIWTSTNDSTISNILSNMTWFTGIWNIGSVDHIYILKLVTSSDAYVGPAPAQASGRWRGSVWQRAAGMTGHIYYSTDNGATWTASTVTPSVSTNGGWVPGIPAPVGMSQNGVVSIDGLLYYSNDRGSKFNKSKSIGYTKFNNLYTYNNTFYAVVHEGPIYYSNINGTNWNQLNTSNHDWNKLVVNENNISVAITYSGSMYHSDNGSNWSEILPLSLGLSLSEFEEKWLHVVTNDNNFVSLNNAGYIFYSQDGFNWTLSQSGLSAPYNNFTEVWVVGTNYMVIDGTTSSTYYSDNGENWSLVTWDSNVPVDSRNFRRWVSHQIASIGEIAVGLTDDDVGFAIYSENEGKHWQISYEFIWSIYPQSVISNGKNFVITTWSETLLTSSIYYSTDKGVTWSQTTEGLPQSTYSILNIESNNSGFVVLINTNNGNNTIYYSPDGIKWKNANAPLFLYNLVTLSDKKIIATVQGGNLWCGKIPS